MYIEYQFNPQRSRFDHFLTLRDGGVVELEHRRDGDLVLLGDEMGQVIINAVEDVSHSLGVCDEDGQHVESFIQEHLVLLLLEEDGAHLQQTGFQLGTLRLQTVLEGEDARYEIQTITDVRTGLLLLLELGDGIFLFCLEGVPQALHYAPHDLGQELIDDGLVGAILL